MNRIEKIADDYDVLPRCSRTDYPSGTPPFCQCIREAGHAGLHVYDLDGTQVVSMHEDPNSPFHAMHAAERSEKSIDHDYTDEVVCPHCGHEHSESWEFSPQADSFDLECDECEMSFVVVRYTSVHYSTRKPR